MRAFSLVGCFHSAPVRLRLRSKSRSDRLFQLTRLVDGELGTTWYDYGIAGSRLRPNFYTTVCSSLNAVENPMEVACANYSFMDKIELFMTHFTMFCKYRCRLISDKIPKSTKVQRPMNPMSLAI